MNWLRLLPDLVKLFNAIAYIYRSERDIGIGMTEAAASALRKASDHLDTLNKAAEEARKRHASDSTDNAFDSEFKRKEP